MGSKKKGEERARIKRKYRILVFGVLLGLLILLVMGIISLFSKPEDVSQGRKILKEMEKRDILKTEEAIRKIRREQRRETTEEDLQDYREVFSGCVIMGDSVASGFSVYGVLDSTNVVAKVGTGLTSYENELKAVTELKPRCIFVYYGFNDVGHVNGDVQLFKQEYTDFINKLKQALPDTKIFVNELFPVKSVEVVKNGAYADLSPYNQAIREVCAEQKIPFLENADLVKPEDYEEDGYHFKKEFYPRWLRQMVEEAEL